MRTLPMKLSGAIVALTVLACLPPAALVRGEERDAKLRQEALKLNNVTGKDPLLGQEIALLKDKAHAKKLLAEATRMAAEKPQPFNYNATLMLGTIAIGVKEYGPAEKFYRLHLEQAEQLSSAKGMMAAYRGLVASSYNRRKYAETEKLCAEANKNKILQQAIQNLQLDKEADEERQAVVRFLFDMFEDQALAIAQRGDVKRAISFIDDRFSEQSDSLLVLDLKGKIYRLAGKNKEAVRVYEAEIEKIKNDNDLKKKQQEQLLDEVRYSLSGVYIEMGEVDKAAEELKALLAKHPDNPTYNNDLGYVWADHDKNLEESEKLIRKALAEDRKQRQKDAPKLKAEEIKDRGAYLDSLGWVLFKQKKYVEAKRYLRQAIQNSIEEDDNESIELYDHLGDVLIALGQKDEAVATWKKGMEAAGETKREQKRKEEVQKKIQANE
jgi:tetratricopeptide (TPR) repeat protein